MTQENKTGKSPGETAWTLRGNIDRTPSLGEGQSLPPSDCASENIKSERKQSLGQGKTLSGLRKVNKVSIRKPKSRTGILKAK